MKAAELREKSVEELKEQLIAQLKEQFELRMKNATGQLGQTSLLKQVRRNIARINTVLKQKAGE